MSPNNDLGSGDSPNNSSSNNIYQQIEGSADYYEPAIYELLSSYSALVTQPDELDRQFVPLTDVRPTNATQTLVFVVGVLPPSSNVTARLLSRNATIASQTDLTAVIPGANNTGLSVTPQSIANTSVGPPKYTKYSPSQISGLIYQVYMQTHNGQAPSQQLVWMLTAQSLRETSGNWPDNNPGFLNSGKAHPQKFAVKGGGNDASGGKYSLWDSYSTPQAGTQNFIISALRTQAEVDAANRGDVTAFVAALGSAGYYAPYIDKNGVHHDAEQAHQEYLNNFQNLYNAAQRSAPDPSVIGVPANGPTPVGSDGLPSNNWKTSGSKNGSTANQNTAAIANTNANLNASAVGQKFLNAQVAMINATLAAIQQMQKTPPLKMLVNPQSFKLSAEKIISDGEWGRNGPIVEHWGENLDKLEASGKVAAFYSVDATGGSSGPGITRVARQYSQAYQNFLSLWLLYKNNGGVWLPPYIPANGSNSSQVSNLSVVGSIYLYYDNILYIGSFDSFNLTESETAPYTLEYNFSFTVRATFLLDNTDDLTLGLSSLRQSQLNPLQGLPSPIMTSTTPGGTALAPNVNPQPAGSVSPPPGLTPAQYAQLGQGAPAVSSNSFTNRR
jgi:hypothetical protein